MNKRFIKYMLNPPILLLPIKSVLFAIGLLIYFFLWVLWPFIKIRIGYIYAHRIGYLAENPEVYLRCRVQRKGPARELYIFISPKPANEQLLKMRARRMFIISSRMAVLTYAILRAFFENSKLWYKLPDTPRHYHEFSNIAPQLSFTPKEEERGRKLLESIGIKPGAPFVAFYARDKAYLKKAQSHKKWSSHDYRDCSIHNFLPAAEYLASLGIYAIRMGYIVNDPIKTDNPYIIDYATNHRSDFGDIYISAKCKFFLGSNGGLCSLAWIFNVPVAYTNGVEPAIRKDDVFMPKKLYSNEKKRFLSFKEIAGFNTMHHWSGKNYEKIGVRPVENTAEEILALTKEVNSRLDGAWTTSKEDEELQEQYRRLLPEGHLFYGFPSRIGAEFLRQNKELLG